jgi:aminoglycoside phosphotransferase (APT) family kinase protein
LVQGQAIADRVADGRKVARISAMHGGLIGAIYEIGFADGPPSFVLKVYPEAWHWKMQKEVRVAALLQDKLSVQVPRILLADDTKTLLDLNFVVMTKLDGDILLGLTASLTPAEVVPIYSQWGQVLRQIHTIPMASFGYIGPHGVWTAHASNRAYMSSQFEKKLTEFVERGGDPVLADRLRASVARHGHLFDECANASLCHYDFHGGNVLVSRKDGPLRISGILDFENAIAGDPILDLAKATLDYAVQQDERKKAALLASYGAGGHRHWQEALELYRMYCVLEFWCWMAQIGNREPLPRLARDLEHFV